MTFEQSISQLEQLVDSVPAKLSAIPAVWLLEAAPGKWNRKQEFGHLVDSACNNLQRFIRGQYESSPHIVYDPDKWEALQHHLTNDLQQLSGLWVLLNRQILWVVRHIPSESLQHNCDTPSPHTLEWLFCDYVDHLQHHIHHLFETTP